MMRTILAVLTVSLTHAATMQINNNGLELAGVRLVGSTDPDFARYFPMPSLQPSVALGPSALPYSVIVINESKRPIASLTIVYDPGGIQNLSTRPGTNSMSALEPGAGRLFNPVFGLAQAVNSGHLTLPLSADQQNDLAPRLASVNRAANVSVSLDSLVWADTGTLEGPDTSNQLGKFTAESEAFADMKTLLTANRGGDLLTALEAVFQRAVTDDYYTQAIHMMADTWTRVIQSQGEEALRSAVTAHKEFKVRRGQQ
jgi:hypothetical protein